MIFIDDLVHWRRICEVYHSTGTQEYAMKDVTDVISILNRYPLATAQAALQSGRRRLPAEWFSCGQDALMRMATGGFPNSPLFYLMEPSVFLKPVEGARRAQRYDRAVNDFFRKRRKDPAATGLGTLPRVHPLSNARDFSDMLGLVYVMNRLAGKPDRVLNP